MIFTITHRNGRMEHATDLMVLDQLLQELDVDDAEHADVAVTSDGLWTLSLFSGGAVVWENVEQGEPRHLVSVARTEARDLAAAAAAGDIDRLERQRWVDGYP
jgi:hypothetical protein